MSCSSFNFEILNDKQFIKKLLFFENPNPKPDPKPRNQHEKPETIPLNRKYEQTLNPKAKRKRNKAYIDNRTLKFGIFCSHFRLQLATMTFFFLFVSNETAFSSSSSLPLSLKPFQLSKTSFSLYFQKTPYIRATVEPHRIVHVCKN